MFSSFFVYEQTNPNNINEARMIFSACLYKKSLDIFVVIKNPIAPNKANNDCLFKYFNTYQHYIDLFWECGSIVGPGRGSSVCFLSNYLMGITQLDPIVWDLKEWRFLNKERVELPKLNIGQYKIGEHIQWCA